MPDSRQALAHLLSSLLDEGELRRLLGQLDESGELRLALPGAGAPLMSLYEEAVVVLYRRGKIDQGFFQALADRSGNRFEEVAAVARQFGEDNLVAPLGPASTQAHATPKGSRGGAIHVHGGNVQVGDGNTMIVKVRTSSSER